MLGQSPTPKSPEVLEQQRRLVSLQGAKKAGGRSPMLKALTGDAGQAKQTILGGQ